MPVLRFLPGPTAALDVCVASSIAAAACGDAAQAAFDRKKIGELRQQGIHYRPLVWTADGRPHPAALERFSTRQTLPPAETAESLHHRWNTKSNPPLHTAQAVHEVATQEYRVLESVNYELVTYTPADWVCLFEARFSLSVQHIRQRFPQGTGSLLSRLARVPSGVLARLALCLASDYVWDRPLSLQSTPSRIGSSAWFLSCLVWVRFLLSGARWFGPPLSTRGLLLSPRFLLSLAPFQNV